MKIDRSHTHSDPYRGQFMAWCFVFVVCEPSEQERLPAIAEIALKAKDEHGLPVFDQYSIADHVLGLRVARVGKPRADVERAVSLIAAQGLSEASEAVLLAGSQAHE